MSNKKRKHGLNGYTEVYQEATEGRVATYFTITRHMESRKKTYFMYWFDNPRNANRSRDPREPDVYRYYFRIRWDKGVLLQKHRSEISDGQKRPGYWVDCSPTDDFNLFPNYKMMVEKIKSCIVEHMILNSSTDSKESI